jgi:hypothetical protein
VKFSTSSGLTVLPRIVTISKRTSWARLSSKWPPGLIRSSELVSLLLAKQTERVRFPSTGLMATRVTEKSALIEARWVIKILLGIVCGLFAMFLLVGLISETNETDRMKACVDKSNREWVKNDCVFPEPIPSSS